VVISEYLESAMAHASYDKLDDGTFGGRIPGCIGVIAFAASQSACEKELRSALEEWVLLGLKMGHVLPVIDGHDLNQEPVLEPLDSM
jgi:hypothetical protein